jgi:RHS repeat-associated protein
MAERPVAHCTQESRRFAVVGLLLLVLLLLSPKTVEAQGEQIEYYGLDALGSVRVIFDAQGNTVDRMDYGPFGENLRAAIKFPVEQFAQLARDSESGTDHALARAYAPETGRFNRVDPVSAGLMRPQLWNRYAYALNSPLIFKDPSGLCPTDYCETVNVTGTFETVPTLPVGLRGIGPGGAGDDLMRVLPEDAIKHVLSAAGGSDADTRPTISCTDYVETVVQMIQLPPTIRLDMRAAVAQAAGRTLQNVGYNDALRFHNVSGFKDSLTENLQGNDVLKHANFVIGGILRMDAPGAASILGLYMVDLSETLTKPTLADRAQARTEAHSDRVFVSIAPAAFRAIATANYQRFERTLKSTICK